MTQEDVYKVALVQSLHGHTMVNTFHYSIAAVPAGLDPDLQLIQAFNELVIGKFAAIQSSQVRYTRIEAQRVQPLPILARRDFVIDSPASQSAPAVPDSVAMVVRRRTATAGRSKRGRIFIGGVASTFYDVTTGRFTIADPALSAATERITTQALFSETSGLSAVPVLFNRVTRLWPVVRQGFLDMIPRTQRRRQLDRGV